LFGAGFDVVRIEKILLNAYTLGTYFSM